MKKKRIVIFNWRDPQDPLAGGAERVTLKHAKYWVTKGHQVTWVSGTFPSANPRQTLHGIHFFRFGNSKTLFLRAWWIFYRDLHGEADVIIDEIHGLPMFSPIWSGDRKVIAFIHEVAQEIWDEMFTFPVSTIGKMIERYAFPLVYKGSQFWVDCQSTQNDLVRLGLSKEHITIIPCAIDSPSLKMPEKKEKALTLIFIARLVKMKGIEHALETFSHILKCVPDAQLLIVGTGEQSYIQILQQKAQKLQISHQVRFLGSVTEKRKYQLIAKSHFLLHTSVREGFGLTVLEANSQLTPSCVFDVAALRDLVTNSRGIIVRFADTKALAKKIVETWSNKKLYLSMQKKAYTFSKTFSWRKFTQQSELLLK